MAAIAAGPRVTWEERTVSVCAGPLQVAVAGSGPPLVVLPRDQGHPPQTAFVDELTARHTVYYPWLAGFHAGHPREWSWLTNVRDLAIVHAQMLDALGLERPVLAGLGFGGWLAAEIATMAAARLRALVLVSPMGIKPAGADIFDQFIVSTEHYAQTAFHDQANYRALYGEETAFEQLEAWETDREMVSRVGWKPYMYNVALPRLLSGITLPALIVWGEDDAVVPVQCAGRYGDALTGSRVERIAACGHAVELEQPAHLAERVATFLSGA